ncbi:putative carbonic anhydrase-like protein [Trypanosoma rangeli]|uniref:carbonic anhydrase n=1 Tax=Trypanosoma rangeli TaxID=5698 RepID=A0A422P1L0_TRYRA|nr:putative carbonic anhydrase-like protein [Trypanosoma rangeli]RNF11610.1 putative carbonic anhydrase-like protein [Trypanosoma rangeli]|eukprot:RNF11610.1 putative carbonic anhydrase-like protein [Trypanosoma rangeli]
MVRAIVFLLLCLQLHLFLQVASAETSYTTAGLPREKPHGPGWGYANLSAWPRLCRTGKQQSPVSFSELKPHEVVYLKGAEPLIFSRGCTFAAEKTTLKILNEVNTISVRLVPLNDPRDEVPGPCTVLDPIAPDLPEYHLVSMHFHSPAEHVFPRAAPDAELHLVFAQAQPSKLGRLMVVAVQLLASDRTNTTSVAELRHILLDGPLPPKNAFTTCTLEKDLAVEGLLPRRRSFLAYTGSLTTPPCTEGVRFIVLTSPQLMPREALEMLNLALMRARSGNHDGNRRPTQPLNGRVVYRYVDRSHVHMSKGDMKDYFPYGFSDAGVWGSINLTTAATSDGVASSHLTAPGANNAYESRGKFHAWPRSLQQNEKTIIIAAALLLFLVAVILYCWRNIKFSAGVGENEVESLLRVPSGYGTNR